MRKPVKISLWTGGILVVFVLLAFLSIYLLLQNSLPRQQGAVQVETVTDSVTITYDAMGIPQIWAENETDAFFAMGWLHASDRLFQMDMTRRIAKGRLAELLGPAVLKIDVHQRTVGHDRIAQRFLPKLSNQNRVRLEAYRDGINAYLQQATLPFEYQLLGADFEPWTVFDCLAVLSFQTWFSDFLMSPDAFLAEAYSKMDPAKVHSLDLPYPEWAPTCTPAPVEDQPLRTALANELFGTVDLPFRMANSSNSWVVDPQHSQSGRAMLASDPHLDVTRLPQFWYQLGIHIKDVNINSLGISTPGLPFITMGHNGQAAYAFTVSGVDVNEYYLEKLNPADSTKYLAPDGWRSLEVFPQLVKISGRDSLYRFDVRTTRHGPLVFYAKDSLQHIALHWAGYDIDLADGIEAGFELYRVQNFEQFRNTVTRFGALDANWTYADKEGNIGYQLGTPVAIRPQKQDNLPVPGWTTEYDWQGFYPLEAKPFSLNPKRGWLATCNNKQDQAGLNYPLYGYYAPDRILRIEQLLKSKEKFSVQDMYDFQMDRHDAYLQRWREILATALEANEAPQAALDIRNWDGYSGKDSHAAVLMVQFLNRLRHLTFDDEFGAFKPKIALADLDHFWHRGPQEWFDNVLTKDTLETRDMIAVRAAAEALKICGNQSWGDFQTLTMQHPLAVVPALRSLLPLQFGPFAWGGTAGTLNASLFFEDQKQPNHFKATVGPSWRFVIDFAAVDSATFVLPAGNSGNPVSAHYSDFFTLWQSGARWKVPLSETEVANRTRRQLILRSPK